MKFWLVRLASVAAAVGACFLLDALVTGKMPGVGPMQDFGQRLVVLAGLYVTLAVSLNLINGITGQFSIGHAAFYQVGAYTAGFVATQYFSKSGLDGVSWVVLMMIVAAAAAAIAGLVVGLPSLRLRGDYLAIVTLGFGEIIRIFVQNQPELGGSYGFNVRPQFQFIWLVWLLAILCIAVCRNLLKTAHGLPFLAVREDEIASSAMGVNVTKVKVTAFVLGSAFAGAAGALFAHYEGFISPSHFSMDVSFIILTMVVLGGTGSITGSAIAGAVLFYLPEKLRDLNPVSGASLVAATIAIIVAVGVIKKLEESYHGPKLKRGMFMVGAILGAIVLHFVLTLVLKNVPQLGNTQYEAAKLRMVIFAGTLIILMLVRPQGVFAHHEFSWSWVKRLFGKSAPTTEVAA